MPQERQPRVAAGLVGPEFAAELVGRGQRLVAAAALESGQEVQLAALFEPGSDYLKVISDYCIAELNKRDIGAWLEGAAPIPENYRVWNITTEGLIITFNERWLQ